VYLYIGVKVLRLGVQFTRCEKHSLLGVGVFFLRGLHNGWWY
jgi:hypothetical protein